MSTTPGAPAQPPISVQGQDNLHNSGPQQPVPTHDEVARQQTGIVYIGPGDGSPQHLMVNSRNGGGTGRGNGVRNARPNPPDDARPGPAAQDDRTAGDENLGQLARRFGEDLEPVRPQAGNNSAAKTYQAGPGDSLGKIAAKFYGSSAKQYRDAIVAANPSLKDNPDRIISGRTYTIPTVEVAGAQPAPAPIPAARGGGGTPAAQEYFYTVRESDSLWRIARDQCGDPKAVAVLKELNKDVLNGSETVRINMKLKLPGKPVSTN